MIQLHWYPKYLKIVLCIYICMCVCVCLCLCVRVNYWINIILSLLFINTQLTLLIRK